MRWTFAETIKGRCFCGSGSPRSTSRSRCSSSMTMPCLTVAGDVRNSLKGVYSGALGKAENVLKVRQRENEHFGMGHLLA